VKRQCPSLAEDGPTLNQSELFDAGALRQPTTKVRAAPESEAAILESDSAPPPKPPRLAHYDEASDIRLYHGNCLDLLDEITAKYTDGIFDMVFADPPYFLSNGGTTCKSGERVAVDKGPWDQSRGLRDDSGFTEAWLRRCQRVLNPGGTLWVSGTHHNIFTTGSVLQDLGFRILNVIVWEKPNPPPNLSCRYFTHSIEFLIWAARNADSEHVFNYDLMRKINRGSQMQSVWRLSAPLPNEKVLGEHPTQKPVALVTRCLLATTCEGDFVFDPFLGSGTSAVACLRNRRRFVGVDATADYVQLAMDRCMAELEQGASLLDQIAKSGGRQTDCLRDGNSKTAGVTTP